MASPDRPDLVLTPIPARVMTPELSRAIDDVIIAGHTLRVGL